MTSKYERLAAAFTQDTVPFWFMRQAGRYLPEYREVRANTGSFLNLCYTPAPAIEVTLQPLRRFDMSAAILFSDILVVPHGLGQKLWFAEGEGPKLKPIQSHQDLDALGTVEDMVAHLGPVYQALSGVRSQLPNGKALIGFAGAPWTLALYMIEGGGDPTFTQARSIIAQQPELMTRLIALLSSAIERHLKEQVAAGANVLQIFDSWAGLADDDNFSKWCLEPIRQIVENLRSETLGAHAACSRVPIIAFPRGVGAQYRTCARELGADALSLDTSVPLDWAAEELKPYVGLQGNLDPALLVAGGDTMLNRAKKIVSHLGEGGGFIFNLGHGVVPSTPPQHVHDLSLFLKDIALDHV